MIKENTENHNPIVKSINAALIIGMIMFIVMWVLFSLLILSDPNESLERTMALIVVFFVTITPALGLHFFRIKVWCKKYPHLRKKIK